MKNSQYVLTQIDHSIKANIPNINSKIHSDVGGGYSLHFRADNQLCKVYFYKEDTSPYAAFYSDGNLLFDVQLNDYELLAKVLQRWVCDKATPSQIQSEFPWLHTATLSDYYDRDRAIENVFMESWDSIERFCNEEYVRCKCDTVLLQDMVRNMRKSGYDRLLRAGTTLLSLGLSRSRRHGLREGQPCIWFEFNGVTMDVYAYFTSTVLEKHPIKFTAEIEQLLQKLAKCKIS
ncbi:hypothetical protein [Candidatus Uabimicrobium amorphum]|uniref:hypothetical protein n=1 Tax=Uabimicrobium amorphum TaxID=2596890 RepID=UPI00125FF42D|nr:hypothetical protein [Candidatus Uabimicrobium amorphum]